VNALAPAAPEQTLDSRFSSGCATPRTSFLMVPLHDGDGRASGRIAGAIGEYIRSHAAVA